MRKIIQLILKFLALAVLKKYRPEIIGVTGSVGKTSTKEAVYTVLKDKFNVRQSPRNYNNELGLPLTILGVEAPGKSLVGWGRVMKKWLELMFKIDKDYPPILVLEMGIDRPGDMKYLTSIVQPQIGIVTAVSHAHLEFFEKVENIKKEKQVLIENLAKNGLAVLNYDNEYTKEMIKESKYQVLSYGLEAGADLAAQEISFNLEKDSAELLGIRFKLNYKGSVLPVSLPKVIGHPAIYAVLPAIAVGLYYQINLVEIISSLADFSLPKGRLNLIPGIKQATIIDDTYNASLDSTLAALDVLDRINLPLGRKVAVLGDMLELGNDSDRSHGQVGLVVAKMQLDLLVVVGKRSQIIGQEAKSAGLDEKKIIYFADSQLAATALPNLIESHDLVLVKASQGIRLERVVKALMVDPDRASELLVRQQAAWL